jgi:hypothetical protein
MELQLALASATIQNAVDGNNDATGFALIMHNTYKNAPGCPPLDTTEDGRAMQDAFESLKFTTVLQKDVKKIQMKALATALARYNEFPEGYKTFVIYFSGHGNKNSVIAANDGEVFNYEDDVIRHLKDDASEFVKKSKILVLIDACRGDQSPKFIPKMMKEDLAPTNLAIAYATREKYCALLDNHGGGSDWSQLMAKVIKEGITSMDDIQTEVKKRMAALKYKVFPTMWNPHNIDINFGGEFSKSAIISEQGSG